MAKNKLDEENYPTENYPTENYPYVPPSLLLAPLSTFSLLTIN